MSKYAFVLIALGLLLAILALQLGGVWLGLWWLAADFVFIGFAYAVRFPGIFGKRTDGSLPLWSWLLFLPYHALNLLIWHAARLTSSEPAWQRCGDSLVIGRRLLGSECKQDFENVIDLTAEFCEPSRVSALPGYRCLPTLDATAPALSLLEETLAALRPGVTFIHCAQGHGRTGLAALAYLLSRGVVRDVPAGLGLLRQVRPGVRLNREQLSCAEAYAARWAKQT